MNCSSAVLHVRRLQYDDEMRQRLLLPDNFTRTRRRLDTTTGTNVQIIAMNCQSHSGGPRCSGRTEWHQQRHLHNHHHQHHHHVHTFLPRDAMLARYMLSSCHLSVRPSVTSRQCIKTAKRRITQTTPYDSAGTLVFWCQRSRQNSNGVHHPNGGAKQRCRRLKSAIFDQYLTISQKQCKIET